MLFGTARGLVLMHFSMLLYFPIIPPFPCFSIVNSEGHKIQTCSCSREQKFNEMGKKSILSFTMLEFLFLHFIHCMKVCLGSALPPYITMFSVRKFVRVTKKSRRGCVGRTEARLAPGCVKFYKAEGCRLKSEC